LVVALKNIWEVCEFENNTTNYVELKSASPVVGLHYTLDGKEDKIYSNPPLFQFQIYLDATLSYVKTANAMVGPHV
jgi:hypothetical protein